MRLACLLFVVLALVAGCGGGGDDGISAADQTRIDNTDQHEHWSGTMPEVEPVEPEAPQAHLPFPFGIHDLERRGLCYFCDGEHYGIDGLPWQIFANARQAPIYHDKYYSLYGKREPNQYYVGVDQGTAHIGGLPIVGERGDIDLRHGRLHDGAGADAVGEYLGTPKGPAWSDLGTKAARFGFSPVVRFGGSRASTKNISLLVNAVQLVNTALPIDWKLQIAPEPVTDPVCTGFLQGYESCHFGEPAVYEKVENRAAGIHVYFVQDLGPAGVATPFVNIFEGLVEYSEVMISDSELQAHNDRRGVIVLAHELLHALGILSHASVELDTIMKVGDLINESHQNTPQPLSILYPVDREALRALYSRLEPGDVATDFGPWASTSTHLHGNGPHAAFGVAWRNGYGEPWAHGYLPDTDLASNPQLSGTATWNGALLGFTPAAEPVAGDAALSVGLSTMTGNAAFTSLELWAAGLAPGNAGTGAVWGDGNLVYSIAVTGNTFRQTGGDDGFLTGAFFGSEHQGMGGTLERDDLTAAFGGTLQD